MVWDNVYHHLADDVTFWLGDDPFYPGFNGDLKNWNVALGTGFRTSGFEELYKEPTPEPVDLKEPDTPEPKLYEAK